MKTRSVGLFLAVEPTAGGMFQYAESHLDALRALQASGWRVEVAYLSDAWHSILSNYPFRTHRLPNGKAGLHLSLGLMALRLPVAVARLLSRFNPVVAALRRIECGHWIFPAQDALTFQSGVAAIGTIHDLMHRYEPHFPEVTGRFRHALREYRFSNIARHSHAVLVDSETGRRHVVDSYGAAAEKIHALPYVAPNYIHNAAPSDFETRYKLPRKFVFYPAQFWPHKNHFRLLDAISNVATTHLDLHLVLTGGFNDYQRTVEQRVAELGLTNRVSFMGYVPNGYLGGFYRRARFMIMPTFFGPTNIPPLEAFACGCACAVSNIYAMPEQTKGAALLFDQTSVADIAQAVERLWSDDALIAELAAKGKAVSREWTIGHFAQRLTDILNQVAAAEHGR